MKLLMHVEHSLSNEQISAKVESSLGSQSNKFRLNSISLKENKKNLELLFDFTLLCGLKDESPQSKKKFNENLEKTLNTERALSKEKSSAPSRQETNPEATL